MRRHHSPRVLEVVSGAAWKLLIHGCATAKPPQQFFLFLMVKEKQSVQKALLLTVI